MVRCTLPLLASRRFFYFFNFAFIGGLYRIGARRKLSIKPWSAAVGAEDLLSVVVGVDDQINALQRAQRLRPDETMGIGDDADQFLIFVTSVHP